MCHTARCAARPRGPGVCGGGALAWLVRCTSCANTPRLQRAPPKARRRCWCCVKPGATQSARRLMLLAHQHNMRCCCCLRRRALRRTLPLFAAALCAPQCLGAMPVRGARCVSRAGRGGAAAALAGSQTAGLERARRSATCFCVPPRFMHHVRPRRAAGGAAGRLAGQQVATAALLCMWVQCLVALYSYL